jgi:hypothetical protein
LISNEEAEDKVRREKSIKQKELEQNKVRVCQEFVEAFGLSI